LTGATQRPCQGSQDLPARPEMRILDDYDHPTILTDPAFRSIQRARGNHVIRREALCAGRLYLPSCDR
jgi:hypothetical protein